MIERTTMLELDPGHVETFKRRPAGVAEFVRNPRGEVSGVRCGGCGDWVAVLGALRVEDHGIVEPEFVHVPRVGTCGWRAHLRFETGVIAAEGCR